MARALVASLLIAAKAANDLETGCLYYGMTVTGPDSNGTIESIDDVNSTLGTLGCQELCKSNANCSLFSYSGTACTLHKQGDYYNWKTGFVSGPKACTPQSPMCSATIIEPWPRDSYDTAGEAFSTGMQPPELQCWPRATGSEPLENTLGHCGAPAVVEDIHQNDSLNCKGLTEVPETQRAYSGGNYTCQESCYRNVLCAVWQVAADGRCWQGLNGPGTECVSRTGFYPIGGQRLQRGEVRVLRNLTGIQIMRLVQVEPITAYPDVTTATEHCKKTCYSDINCEFWQLSAKAGCFIEARKPRYYYQRVINPLINATSAVRWGEEAEQMIAGEYIQRTCPTKATAAPMPPAGTGNLLETTTTLAITTLATTTPAPNATTTMLLNTTTETMVTTTLAGNAATGETTLTGTAVTGMSTTPAVTVTTHDRGINMESMTTTTSMMGALGSSGGSSDDSSLAASSGGSSSMGLESSGSTSSIPWWLLLGLIALAVLAGACSALMAVNKKKEKSKTKKTKKTRSTKTTAEEVPLVVAEPEPVLMTVSEPVATYAPAETIIAPAVQMVAPAPPVYMTPPAPAISYTAAAPAMSYTTPAAAVRSIVAPAQPAYTAAAPVTTYTSAPAALSYTTAPVPAAAPFTTMSQVPTVTQVPYA